MNYIILQKDSIIIPVDIMVDTAGEEIRSLQDQGFAIVCDSLEASSTEQAINKWESKKSPVLVGEKVKKKTYESNYGIAQLVVMILSFIGWCTVIIGIVVILVGVGSVSGGRYSPSFLQLIASMSPGFITAITGIFSVAAAQIVKATVDNADHSYQILKHLESK